MRTKLLLCLALVGLLSPIASADAGTRRGLSSTAGAYRNPPAGLDTSAAKLPSARLALPPSTGYDVIAAINAYRAQYGLYAYQTNSILMGTAQNQADYQASIGIVTHTGPGNTTPKDRALLAGYGGGQNIFLSEIIYGGYSATLDTAMEWWKNSPIHNNTMLSSMYVEIGAGVSTNGSQTFFTAEMGYVAGGIAPSVPSGANSTPFVYVNPVLISTPRADGSVVHVVQAGQTVWGISAAYNVSVDQVLELNGLPPNPYIFPGQELLIMIASTPTPTATATRPPATITPTRTATRQITIAPQGTPISGVHPLPSGASGDAAEGSAQSTGAQGARSQGAFDNPAVSLILILSFASLLLVFGANFFLAGRSAEPPEPPEDEKPDTSH